MPDPSLLPSPTAAPWLPVLTAVLALVAIGAVAVAVIVWRRLRVVTDFVGIDAMAHPLARQTAERLRFHTAIDNMSQGLCFFDGERRLIVCNARYARMYGLAPALCRPGTTLGAIVDARYDAGTVPKMERAEYLAWRARIASVNVASDTVVELRDGRTFAIHHQPMPDGGWVATHDDITERRRTEAQIERMAHCDALTGLANRSLFRERLDRSLGAGAPGATTALLLIDLDRFKAVNDTLGHPVGDALLRATAQRLIDCVREGDLVARLGGDEFAIVQAGADQPGGVRGLAERVVGALREPFEIAGHRICVGASAGAALAPVHGTDPDELMSRADTALYEAKSAGRGRFSLFDAVMSERALERRLLEADLRVALERGEFELFYQPIVRSGRVPRVVAFEALLRWNHPRLGQLLPDDFIRVAEEIGVIAPIGAWVLHTAFAEAARWPAELAVTVNLSPLQFAATGGLTDKVRSALRAAGLPPARVELEITESALLAESSANVAALHTLRALGVRVCLDDFGVGYSSLSYLRSFPFHKIKIDRSFVRDLLHSEEAAAIVKAIAALAKSLRIGVVAEGVDAEGQIERLAAFGCDEMQGFYLSPPRSAAEVPAVLLKLQRRFNGSGVAG